MPSFFRYNIVIDLVGVSVVGLIMIGLRREREHNSDYKTVYRALTHCLLAVLCLDIPAWVLIMANGASENLPILRPS